MPKLCDWGRTKRSVSTKESTSRRSVMRSRAVFLPRACCFWTAVSSAAETAAASRSRRSSRRWAVVSGRGGLVTGPPAAAWQSREDPGGEHGDTTLLIAAPDQAQAQDQGVWSEDRKRVVEGEGVGRG